MIRSLQNFKVLCKTKCEADLINCYLRETKNHAWGFGFGPNTHYGFSKKLNETIATYATPHEDVPTITLDEFEDFLLEEVPNKITSTYLSKCRKIIPRKTPYNFEEEYQIN